MSGRPLQASRGVPSRSSDGFPSRFPGASGPAAARRRSASSVGGSKGSKGGSKHRSLQEISIPEGMDEEVR